MVKIIIKGPAFSIEKVVPTNEVKTTVQNLKDSGVVGSISIEKL